MRHRVESFCQRFGLRVPILLAPMAGACPPGLSVAVGRAGGMGGCGVLTMPAEEILDWARALRAGAVDAFQLNDWIPGPAAHSDPELTARLCAFLSSWGPAVGPQDAHASLPDFDAQCEAMLSARPPVISSVMGLFAAPYVRRLKQAGIAWFATVTTLAEARAAEQAGADGLIAQGMEAGGHRGSFDAAAGLQSLVGLLALVPALADAVRIPVVAAGGIADGRGIAAALLLGASAVQIGTAFLRCPEAQTAAAWAVALAGCAPEDTMVSRVFSGRAGRSILTDYVRAATSPAAPAPAAYPIQRALTARMRREAVRADDVQRMQAWAGQSARLARALPAAELTGQLWQQAQELLSGAWR